MTDENSVRAKHAEDCGPPPVVEYFDGAKWRNGRNDDALNGIVELNGGWHWYAGVNDGRCESRDDARKNVWIWWTDKGW